MNGFDQLGRELESAAERRRAVPWARRVAGAGGAVAFAVALATVAVVAVGAVLLLHGRRTPVSSGSSAQPASVVQGAAWARAFSCPRARTAGNAEAISAPPTMSDDAPDPRLLAALGALRGPWTPADAAPGGSCVARSPLFPATAFDVRYVYVRYVRYVGPGVRGGKVFLVPANGLALPMASGRLPANALSPLLALSHEPFACLITVGGSAGSTGLGACTPLSQIEHPLGFAEGEFAPHALPVRVIRQVCSHLPARLPHTKAPATARARCLALILHQHLPAPQPQVVYGVVRDGVSTVDVSKLASRAGKPVLTGVPVRDNVFSFIGSRAVAGPLRLVFRDSSGHVIPSSPVHFGTLRSNSVVTSSASGIGRANIQLVGGALSGLPARGRATTGTISGGIVTINNKIASKAKPARHP